MPTSFQQTQQLTCPRCGQPFEASIWLIVDAAERPDLLEKIQAGTLHQVVCPHCQFQGEVDAPLLLYNPPLPEGLALPISAWGIAEHAVHQLPGCRDVSKAAKS